MSETASRACWDCRHCRAYRELPDISKCLHEELLSDPDVVTGERKPGFCFIARDEGQPCGPDGRLFERRPERRERLRDWLRMAKARLPFSGLPGSQK